MSEDAEWIKSVFRRLLSLLCKYPGDVEINVAEYGQTIEITPRSNRADTGRIIGQGGQHYQQLVVFCRLMRQKVVQHNVILNLMDEPVKGTDERFSQWTPSVVWPKDEILSLIGEMSRATFRAPLSVTEEGHGTDRSLITIHISARESQTQRQEFHSCLQILFRAVGRAVGRRLIIDVNVDHEAAPLAGA